MKTPLQVNLDRIGKSLARAAFAVVVVIVILGLFRGQPFIEMLIFGVALAVAVVPEALPCCSYDLTGARCEKNGSAQRTRSSPCPPSKHSAALPLFALTKQAH